MGLLKEHQWLVSHPKELEKHRGIWIAVLDGKIIATGNNYEEVYNRSKKKYPDKYPLITYILKKEEEDLIAFL